MDAILYCPVCSMPPEYCRYSPKYDKCLEWMHKNQPDLFAIEIKDLSERDPKTYKKTQHLWDENAPSPEEKKSDNNNQSKKSKKKNKKQKQQQQNNIDEDELKQTKQVKIIENQVRKQEEMSKKQMADIQSKLAMLSTNNTSSPSKSILKNPENPNFEQEKQKLDAMADNDDISGSDEDITPQYLGRGGNINKARGPPSRKDTKKKKRGKKKQNKWDKKRRGRGRDDDEEEDDENKENEEENEEEARKEMVKIRQMQKGRKLPKNLVEVILENRKGNKKVTVVRGYLEKAKFKESEIKSEFMKKFATSVNITFQNPGQDKGPKQVVLMGDKRYDFMKYLYDKFPAAGKLLYYKTKKYGPIPALHPDHGFVMAPPKYA